MEIQGNIKKAEEIAVKWKAKGLPYNAIYDSCLEMAQWKDEQFSKFLLWLDDFYVIRKFDDGEPMTYTELIDNFKSNNYERNTTKTD